jgi:hypothetical protein
MGELDFSVQVISDKFQEFRVNSSASASEVIARVLKDVAGDTGGRVDPNEYRVLVAYQLLSPELSLDKLFQQEESGQLNVPTATLEELGVKTGYYIFFIKPTTVSTKLEININENKYIINKQDLFVGRKDEDKNIHPDLDLTQFLGAYSNKVSRQLLTFREVDGKWMVKLHQNAQTSVFLDANKLKHGEERVIGDTINIGNSPEDPYVRIKTKILSD